MRLKLTAQRGRRLQAFLERAQRVPELAGEARQLVEFLRPVSKRPTSEAALDRKQNLEKQLHAERLASIGMHAAVRDRAAGKCEACRVPTFGRSRHDHWLGGSGRRREMESVETVWELCIPCDTARTANDPSAAAWNEKRRVFCERVGLPFIPHVEHEALRVRKNG